MLDNLEIIEKKQVKKHLNKLAGILIGYSSMVFVITIGYMITKIIGISIRNYENKQIMDQLIEELLVDLLSNGILPIIGVILGMVFILLYRKKQFFTYDLVHVNHKMKIKTLFLLLICFMAPQFIFSIVSIVLEIIFNQFGYSIIENINPIPEGSLSLSMCLYIISSILFGAVHANIVQGFYAVLVGLVFGYVAVEYSIKWSILLHIANNLLSTILMNIYSNMSETMSNYIHYSIFGIIFITSCIILYGKRKEIREYLKSNVTDKKIYLYTFTSFWIIVFLVVYGLLSLTGITKLTP